MNADSVQERADSVIRDLAGKYCLRPRWLREVLWLRFQGKNYSEIRTLMEVDRNTSLKYGRVLKKMTEDERQALILSVVAWQCSAPVLTQVLGS